MKRLRWTLLIVALVGGCLTTEFIGRSRVSPIGRVSTLNEYLAWQPDAVQFVEVDVGGKKHVIAYGSTGSSILLSSGPPAYVFDDQGRLVDWSADIGDDPQFDQLWVAQRSRSMGGSISRNAAIQIAATQPAGT